MDEFDCPLDWPELDVELWQIEPDEIMHVTEKAYLVKCGDVEAWLPKSLIQIEGKRMIMPLWLAEEKGLDLVDDDDDLDSEIPF